MINMDQIESELKTIEKLDAMFIKGAQHNCEETIGFEARQFRKRELQDKIESLAARKAYELERRK
jgi:hypothetical protein